MGKFTVLQQQKCKASYIKIQFFIIILIFIYKQVSDIKK